MKKLLLSLALLLGAIPFAHAQQQIIYCISTTQTACSDTAKVGSGTQGDPAWLFNGKSNANFTQLYGMFGASGLLIGNGAVPSPLTSLQPSSGGTWCLNWGTPTSTPALVSCPGGTPGGTTYQLQYNNGGVFGGIGLGTSGLPLLSGGSGGPPSFGQIALGGSWYTGTLPIAAGGTNASTAAAAMTNLLPTYISSDCLSNNGTALQWISCGGSGTAFQTNGLALSSSATVNFENSAATGGLTLTFSNPSAGNVQLGLSGWPTLVGGDCLTNNGTALSWGTCGVVGTVQANGTNVTNPATLNFQNSAATGGLTLTVANPSLGNLQLGLSGWPGTLVNGDCLTNNGTALSWGACGTPAFSNLTGGTNTAASMIVGTGASLSPTGSGTINANQINGQALPASASCVGTNASGQVIANCPEPVTQMTATAYTVDSTWCGTQRVFTSASAVSVSLPELTACQFDMSVQGAGTVTVTPSAGTINGSASAFAIATNRQATLNYDTANTNWGCIGCTALVTGTGGTPSDVQVFTSSGTWTKPSGSPKYTRVIVIGAGGGGGGGAMTASGTGSSGGASGGSGYLNEVVLQTSSLGATETVTVGTGGTAGAAATVAGAGGDGGAGSASSFGSWITAGAGGAGKGGQSGTTSQGGASAGGAISATGQAVPGGFGSAGDSAGAVGNASGAGQSCPGSGGANGGAGTNGCTAGYGPGGAGAGGGVTTTPGVTNGGAGGFNAVISSRPSGGTGSVTTATAGSAGTNPPAGVWMAGTGGGGGGSTTTGTAGAGGAGGIGAAGGGGGSCNTGATACGAGGAGGNGEVIVITTY